MKIEDVFCCAFFCRFNSNQSANSPMGRALGKGAEPGIARIKAKSEDNGRSSLNNCCYEHGIILQSKKAIVATSMKYYRDCDCDCQKVSVSSAVPVMHHQM